jgi:hypothetical protein
LGSGARTIHCGNKTVPAASYGFDVSRFFGGVVEGGAQAVNRCVQTVVEINEGIGGPDSFLKFFAGCNLTRIFQQRLQNQERLLLQTYANASSAKLARPMIEFVIPEPGHWRRW